MDKEKRLAEIDQRIEDLEAHAKMWGNARGVGGNMMIQAWAEINDLKLEREDLINGTHNLEKHKREKEIERLNVLLEQAKFIKKIKYRKELKAQEEALNALIEEDAKLKH